jgi:hypothetical protein
MAQSPSSENFGEVHTGPAAMPIVSQLPVRGLNHRAWYFPSGSVTLALLFLRPLAVLLSNPPLVSAG